MKRISKSIYYWCGISVIVVAIIAFATWLLWPKSYEDMIPAQAKAVLCFDGQSFHEALSDSERGILQELSKKGQGLDLSQPIYGIITPNEYISIVAKVDDEEKIEAMLSAIEGKKVNIDDYDDRQWAWLSDGWLASWDKRSFICIGPGVKQERDVLRQTITSMINTGDKFVDTSAFTKLKAQTGNVKIYAQLDAIPAPYNMLFRFNIPADCDPAAVEVFASADLKAKGKEICLSQLDCNITSENDDIIAAIDTYEKEKGCIEANDITPNDSILFRLSTSTKGKSLLQLLKTDATLRGLLMGLNQTFDADKLLGSTDGMFSIEINSFAKDWTPAFCLKAETHTPNLFVDADYWMESAKKQKNVTLTRNGENAFFLDGEKQQLHFGLLPQANVLYFASPSMLSTVRDPFVFKKSSNKEGTLVYFHVRLDKLRHQPCMADGIAQSIINKLLPSSAQGLTYEAKTGRKAKLKFE